MQIIKASRDAILKPLQTVAGIVEKRHTLADPGQRADPQDRRGRVLHRHRHRDAGADPCRRSAPASENATVTVSARKLIDILRALPESEVTVTLNGTKLAVSAGKSRFALQTLPAADFPTLAVGSEVTSEATLPQKQLKNLLQMVHFAMAQQDIRFYLNGLLLVMSPQGIRSVATDGHRLAFCAHAGETASAAAEVIMPRKTVTELLRLLGDNEEPVLVQVIGHQIRISFGEVEIRHQAGRGQVPRLPAGDPDRLQQGDRDQPRAVRQRAQPRVHPHQREVQGRAPEPGPVAAEDPEQQRRAGGSDRGARRRLQRRRRSRSASTCPTCWTCSPT